MKNYLVLTFGVACVIGPSMLLEANGASLDGCLIWNNIEIF
jgi:hypothetical protein